MKRVVETGRAIVTILEDVDEPTMQLETYIRQELPEKETRATDSLCNLRFVCVWVSDTRSCGASLVRLSRCLLPVKIPLCVCVFVCLFCCLGPAFSAKKSTAFFWNSEHIAFV